MRISIGSQSDVRLKCFDPKSTYRRGRHLGGELDKKGKPLRFSRDLECAWTVGNDEADYGVKEHASVDIKNGFVLATTMTFASEHDTNYLAYLTIAGCHTEQPIKKVYADKGGYFGEANEAFLCLNEIQDGIMGKIGKQRK